VETKHFGSFLLCWSLSKLQDIYYDQYSGSLSDRVRPLAFRHHRLSILHTRSFLRRRPGPRHPKTSWQDSPAPCGLLNRTITNKNSSFQPPHSLGFLGSTFPCSVQLSTGLPGRVLLSRKEHFQVPREIWYNSSRVTPWADESWQATRSLP